MGTYKRIPQEIKEQVMARVREGKESVAEIARQHGLNTNTIYGWVGKGLQGVDSTVLENNRLRRENRELKEILGKYTLDLERGKKIRYGS